MRPKRMVTKDISAITGYIPEVMYKMTPAEMNDFVLRGSQNPESLEDTDIIPEDYETTQAELTPMSSGGFSSLPSTSTAGCPSTNTAGCSKEVDPALTEDELQLEAMIENDDILDDMLDDDSTELVSDASEETVTASMSSDEVVVFQRLQETSHPLDDKVKNLKLQTHSSSISSSPGSNSPGNNNFGFSANCIGLLLNEKLQQLKHINPVVVVRKQSCSMQQQTISSRTDSESSDGERVCIEQLA